MRVFDKFATVPDYVCSSFFLFLFEPQTRNNLALNSGAKAGRRGGCSSINWFCSSFFFGLFRSLVFATHGKAMLEVFTLGGWRKGGEDGEGWLGDCPRLCFLYFLLAFVIVSAFRPLVPLFFFWFQVFVLFRFCGLR